MSEAGLNVPLKSRSTIKRLYLESSLNPFVEEMCQRRKKGKKYSHMEGQLAQIAKKIEPISSVRRLYLYVILNKLSITNKFLTVYFLTLNIICRNIEISITIGHYSAIRNMPILDKEFYLFSEQYKTLQPEKWIDRTIIDYCFAIFHINHWKNIMYMYPQIIRHLYWVIILIENQMKTGLCKYNVTEEIHGKMLLPYLY